MELATGSTAQAFVGQLLRHCFTAQYLAEKTCAKMDDAHREAVIGQSIFSNPFQVRFTIIFPPCCEFRRHFEPFQDVPVQDGAGQVAAPQPGNGPNVHDDRV